MKLKLTEANFLKDIATHKLTIARDDGLYRHLRFRRPDMGCYHFDIVTWPGFLAYTGDMGAYVFTRLEDMFHFFRSSGESGKVKINPSYWAEKCEAIDRNGPIKEYDPETFRSNIERYMTEAKASSNVRRAVRDQVLGAAESGNHEAVRAAMEFEFSESDGNTFRFLDFWEYDNTEFSHRFLWCLYAIAWGIAKYDATKETG